MSTSSSAKTVNYIDLFTHKELTKCIGEPTYAVIKKIENQCKANAQRFNTTLGGGNHKYLGLILSPARYALLSAVPFERPENPQPLVIPAGTTAVNATAMRDAFEEQKRLYNECEGIETAIKQQLRNAFEPDYLADLIDRNTQSLLAPIHEIFEYLYSAFGAVTIAEFYDIQQQLEDAPLNLSIPLTVLWNKIEDLKELAEHIKAPISDNQCINIALRKLLQTKAFPEEIKKWNNLPNKTWSTFKIHFRKAQQELKELGGLQVQDTPFQANLVQDVIDGVNALLESHLQEPSTAETAVANEATQPVANAATQSTTSTQPSPMQPDMMQQFQMFMQLQNMFNQNQNGGRSRNRSRNGQGGRSGRGGRGRGYGRNNARQTVVQYCWTHGACTHNGFTCRNPAQGHIPQATLANRMNGNNANCDAPNDM